MDTKNLKQVIETDREIVSEASTKMGAVVDKTNGFLERLGSSIIDGWWDLKAWLVKTPIDELISSEQPKATRRHLCTISADGDVVTPGTVLTNRYGSAGVISRIIPDSDLGGEQDPTGAPKIILSAHAIHSRMGHHHPVHALGYNDEIFEIEELATQTEYLYNSTIKDDDQNGTDYRDDGRTLTKGCSIVIKNPTVVGIVRNRRKVYGVLLGGTYKMIKPVSTDRRIAVVSGVTIFESRHKKRAMDLALNCMLFIKSVSPDGEKTYGANYSVTRYKPL